MKKQKHDKKSDHNKSNLHLRHILSIEEEKSAAIGIKQIEKGDYVIYDPAKGDNLKKILKESLQY